MSRLPVAALSLSVLVVGGTALGQVSVSSTTVSVPSCSGAGMTSYDVDVYQPTGAGPHALVGVAHGFQLSKDAMSDVARALAEDGAVVVVPQFPLLLRLQCGASDHARNADILWAAMAQRAATGDVDAARLGVVGHSAGGLSAWVLAASRAVAAVVLLDPTDSNNLGVGVSASVSAAALFVFAPAAQCNAQGNAAAWFTPKPGEKARLRVVGAGHCDAQSPTSSTCTAGCGGASSVSAARQALFRDWATVFFSVALHGSARCLATEAQQAAATGVVDAVDFQLSPCAAPADGGGVDAGAEDAGAEDAGVEDAGVEDAGVEDAGVEDAGVDAGQVVTADGGAPDGVPGEPAGCGCGQGGGVACVAVTLLFRRRRVRAAAR